MPRVALTPQGVPRNSYASLTMTAGDATEEHIVNGYANTRIFLILHNDGATPRTAIIQSVADSQLAREGDISIVVAANAIVVAGPFQADGFAQADKSLHVDVDHAELRLAAVYLPTV